MTGNGAATWRWIVSGLAGALLALLGAAGGYVLRDIRQDVGQNTQRIDTLREAIIRLEALERHQQARIDQIDAILRQRR
jgi:predicted anti-sigma-YlaC factor YlaD